MSTFRLDRRAMLRGAGTLAIALPWLEIMGPIRRASAAPAPAQRFLAVYTPGGTVTVDGSGANLWRPSGTEDAPVLSPILAPLERVKSRMIVVDGLDMASARGEQSQSGMIAWLTGTAQANIGFATGPSIDQVLAGRIGAGRRLASLQMAVRWGTRRSHGNVSPINIVNFADDAAFTPVAPRLDPAAIWQELFGAVKADNAARARWEKSILDHVDRRYVNLAQRLGASDKHKLEQHLTRLREMEVRVAQTVVATAACKPPPLSDTSGYNPYAGKLSDDGAIVVDRVTDAAIPQVGRLMTDMMVMAMACNLTNVGTLQWSDGDAGYSLPWLNLPEVHYYYENGGGYIPAALTRIHTWYSAQHAYLIEQMASVDMGGHSLLDESVVFFGTEVAHPATHVKKDMPFLLAGGGGGLRGGRWLRYDHRSHNDLLVALFNLFGDPRTTFGSPQFSTAGALPNLT